MRMFMFAAAAALAGGAYAQSPQAVTPGSGEVATAPQAGAQIGRASCRERV